MEITYDFVESETSKCIVNPIQKLFLSSHQTVNSFQVVLQGKDSVARNDTSFLGSLEAHASVYSRFKRTLDILGACVGLGFFTAIFPILAIAIAMDSRGPIFYSQKRCGLKGKPFRIWKLRSMVVDADRLKDTIQNEAKGLIFKNKNDPRITRVGCFLRKTSLDEFPQFWNVLKGEMSLVGTRPPTLDEAARYSPHHWLRLRVKPGITGEWQAKGRSQVDDFEAIVAMDLNYQSRWSVAYDLHLIWTTVIAVVQRRGAC